MLGSGSILCLNFLEGAACWWAICVCAARRRASVLGRLSAGGGVRSAGCGFTIRGKRVGAGLKALERSLESRGLAPGRRRAEPRLSQTVKTRPASGPFDGCSVVFGPAADSELAGTDLGAEPNRSRHGTRPISAKGAPGKRRGARRGGRLVVRTVGPGRRRLRQRQQGHTIDNMDVLQCLSVRKRTASSL